MRNLLLLLFSLVLFHIPNAQAQVEKWITTKQGCKAFDPLHFNDAVYQWSGNCRDGYAQGYGRLTATFNSYSITYEGDFKKGMLQGKGKYTNSYGEVIQGNFMDGQVNGYGVYQFSNGDTYEGNFVNFFMHGKGVMKYNDGSKAEGFYVADKLYTGKFTVPGEDVIYYQEYFEVERINEKPTNYKPQLGKEVIEYFDSNWKRTEKSKAVYFRKITYEEHNKPRGRVRDYYMKNNRLQSEFSAAYIDYNEEEKNLHKGEAKWYYESGKLQQAAAYFGNSYHGKYTSFYENGNKAIECFYFNGKKDGDYKTWYQNGKPKFSGSYNMDYRECEFLEYAEDGSQVKIHDEHFLLQKSLWEKNHNDYEAKVTYLNRLELTKKTAGRYQRSASFTINTKKDFSIEARVRRQKGTGSSGYGLSFGFKDWDNYCSFLITETGEYKIFAEYEGKSIVVANWVSSNAIQTGNKSNILKVIKTGGSYNFYINEVLVKTTPFRELPGKEIGLDASGEGVYLLEKLVVKEY